MTDPASTIMIDRTAIMRLKIVNGRMLEKGFTAL
jgi:hypothetical protein